MKCTSGQAHSNMHSRAQGGQALTACNRLLMRQTAINGASDRSQAPAPSRGFYGMVAVLALVLSTLFAHTLRSIPLPTKTTVSIRVIEAAFGSRAVPSAQVDMGRAAAARAAQPSVNSMPALSSSKGLPAQVHKSAAAAADASGSGEITLGRRGQLEVVVVGDGGKAAPSQQAHLAAGGRGISRHSSKGMPSGQGQLKAFESGRSTTKAPARQSQSAAETAGRSKAGVQPSEGQDLKGSRKAGTAQPVLEGVHSGVPAHAVGAKAQQAAPTVQAEANPAGASEPAKPKLTPQELLSQTLAEPKLPAGRNRCEALLQVPKVALLFLTVGPLPHERLWAEWLSHAVGLLPVDAVARYAATAAAADKRANSRKQQGGGALGILLRDRERLSQVAEACRGLAANSTAPLRDRQLLFSLYVHTSPGAPPYGPSSLFAGTVIPRLMATSRHNHDVMEAERLLLGEALRDPLNQRFLLLSETHLPLYSASALYSQLLAEKLSRMDGCTVDWELWGNRDRWNENMVTPRFKPEHWRKTSQFFSATRMHAELIANDTEVNAAFVQHCRIMAEHPITKRESWCSSNEHYPAIIMAVHGLDNETTCFTGGTTFVDWSTMDSDGHPRSYMASETTEGLVQGARTAMPECSKAQTEAAAQAAPLQFVNATDLADRVAASAQILLQTPPSYPALNGRCSLFIRKFPADTAAAALQAFQRFIQ